MKIAVIGAGTMGFGITQILAETGYEVIMRDINESFVDKGIKQLERTLRKMFKRGK